MTMTNTADEASPASSSRDRITRNNRARLYHQNAPNNDQAKRDFQQLRKLRFAPERTISRAVTEGLSEN